MSTPPISIIIPVFNGGDKIKKTLCRLSECEGASDAEIIVVNDGSTDETLSILSDISRYIKFDVINKDNGGPGSARNVGAANSSGKYIIFLGDDTAPSSKDFLIRHLDAHTHIDNPHKAVLGKIIWPSDRVKPLTLTEYLIQGDGQQQFGFKYMVAKAEYDWKFFYTSNISFRREMVDDWSLDGFSTEFYLAAFEDGEFAYRLTKRYPDFGVVYCPTACVEHNHPYTFSKFISRQLNCGQMMEKLLSLHPEISNAILPTSIKNAMNLPQDESIDSQFENLVAVIEGIKAFCELYDSKRLLGTENWHANFINASLSLFTCYGYILSADIEFNRSAALSCLINDWSMELNKSAHQELFGGTANLFSKLP